MIVRLKQIGLLGPLKRHGEELTGDDLKRAANL